MDELPQQIIISLICAAIVAIAARGRVIGWRYFTTKRQAAIAARHAAIRSAAMPIARDFNSAVFMTLRAMHRRIHGALCLSVGFIMVMAAAPFRLSLFHVLFLTIGNIAIYFGSKLTTQAGFEQKVAEEAAYGFPQDKPDDHAADGDGV